MTLRMGDRTYASAAWVSHYATHPHAPVQHGISEMLRAAFADSQNHGRSCLQQGWPFDVQDLSGDLSNVRSMRLSSSALFGGVTRGYRRIPREISHLRARLIFSLQTFSETQVDLRLTAIDSSANTDTATRTEIIDADPRRETPGLVVTPSGVGGAIGVISRLVDAEFPFTGPFGLHTAIVDLPLANIDTQNPGVCEIRLEMRANSVRSSSLAYEDPVGIRPFWASIFTRMDDFGTAIVDSAEGATTMSPLALSFDQDVLAENFVRIHRAQEWSMRRRPTCHISMLVAPDGWDDYSGGSTEAMGTIDVQPDATDRTFVQTSIRIEPEDANYGSMTCGAECALTSGDEVTLTFSFTGTNGTVQQTVICTDADNGTEVTATVNLSGATPGDEWVDVEISAQLTAGGGPAEVRTIRVEEDELGALPAPRND